METGRDPAESWTWRKLCAGVLLIWAAAGSASFFLAGYLPARFPGVRLAETGTFGDTFGAVNSLFSALGVAGVAYALILQYREQRDARIEAEYARKCEADRCEAERRRDAESRRHDAELAMIAAQIDAYTSLMNYYIKNHNHSANMLLNHRDEIDLPSYQRAVNLQSAKLDELRLAIERLAAVAEEKAGIGLDAVNRQAKV